jgi:peptidyl-tRNA hydrolase, PTH1 family
MWLVTGLGNPGRQYDWTRHNIGFQVIDQLAAAAGEPVTRLRGQAHTASVRLHQQQVILAKPQTFMNRSGSAVQALMAYYKIPAEQLLVVCDDVALPLGEIRFRQRGGNGGHRGLQHIIQVLGTEDFCRLRVGIDNKPEAFAELSDYVLGVFPAEQRDRVSSVVQEAAEGVREWVDCGIDHVMNRYNRRTIDEGK